MAFCFSGSLLRANFSIVSCLILLSTSLYVNCNSINNVSGQHRWLFAFSGSLLRANFSIVSSFFLFDTVIVRGKWIFLSFFLNLNAASCGKIQRERETGRKERRIADLARGKIWCVEFFVWFSKFLNQPNVVTDKDCSRWTPRYRIKLKLFFRITRICYTARHLSL